MRMPYPKIYGVLQTFSEMLGQNITRSVHKFNLTYRDFAQYALTDRSKPLIEKRKHEKTERTKGKIPASRK